MVSSRPAVYIALTALVALLIFQITDAAPITLANLVQEMASKSVASTSSAKSADRSDRVKRSEEPDDTENESNLLPFQLAVADETGMRPTNDELDEGSKRGSWAKNNMKMWGKRAYYKAPWVGRKYKSPADGSWTKRKQTWERNNFKMWGKRSGNGVWNDDEAGNVNEMEQLKRRLAVEFAERVPSQEEISDGERDREGAWTPNQEATRRQKSKLEQPSSFIINDDDWRDILSASNGAHHELPSAKRGAWASNNMRIWG